MSKSVFFFILLTLCSYAYSRTRNIDRVMTALVSLNQKAGRVKLELDIVLSEVSSALKENIEMNEMRNRKFAARCEEGKSILQEYIHKLEMDTFSIDALTRDSTISKRNAENEVKKYTEIIEGVKMDITNLQSTINKTKEQYKQISIEAEQKMVVIKTIKDIITDELLHDNSHHVTSFVQLKSKTFMTHVNQLKSILNDIPARESIYSPMLVTLITLAQNKNFSDVALLKKILEILNRLQNNLIEFRKKEDKGQKRLLEDYENSIKTKRDEIKLNMNILNEAKSTIKASEDFVRFAEREVKQVSLVKQRKEKESEYWTIICEYQKKMKNSDDKWSQAVNYKLDEINNLLLDN